MKDVNDDHVMMPNFPGNLLNYFAFSSSSASFEKKTFSQIWFWRRKLHFLNLWSSLQTGEDDAIELFQRLKEECTL